MNIGLAAAAVMGVFTLAIFMKLMAMTSENNELRGNLIGTQREAKKVQDQLDAKKSKYEQKANEASKKGTKAKGQKQRIAQLSDELHASKATLSKVQEQVKEFSGEINRLRIEREDLRREASAAKAEVKIATAPVDTEKTIRSTEASNEASSHHGQEGSSKEPMHQPPRKQSLTRLERDLERSQQDFEKLRESFRSLKRRLVEQTAELRLFKRKNEHNRRAYTITQLQLDLLQDENYVLKHGHAPPYSQSDKQGKRAALRPDEEVIKPDLDSAPIELPDFEEVEEEIFAPIPQTDEIPQEEAPQADEAESDPMEADDQEEVSEAVEQASSEEPVQASLAEDVDDMVTQDGDGESAAPEAEQEAQKSGTVKRRRKNKVDEGALGAVQLVSETPPRPVAE